MGEFQIKKTAKQYDAVIVGSGAGGGMAAYVLASAGLKVCLLEAGADYDPVKHSSQLKNPWESKRRGASSKYRPFGEFDGCFWGWEIDGEPYTMAEGSQKWDWWRARMIGGRTNHWGRISLRFGPKDFKRHSIDGLGADWPIGYEDLAPWYSHVEKFAGISGNKDGLPHLPDGEFLPAFPLNCVEKYFSDFVAQQYRDRQVIVARCAHITEAQPIHIAQGRAKCQHRTLCERGCPLGGYFSSNASTIPWAMKTGNLTLLSDALVAEVLFDEKKNKASGVRVINTITGESTEYFAKIIFVNGAALNSNLILLNSTSRRFPNGLGNDNGLMGKYVAFHNYKSGINAEYEGNLDVKTDGRRPTSGYIFPDLGIYINRKWIF